MAINKLTITPMLLEALVGINCWGVVEADIERLAPRMAVNFQVPLLRCGDMRAVIAGKRFGSDVNRFTQEFEALAIQCVAIRNCRDGTYRREEAEIYAAAFFHLRWANIHPLSDCNGRMGRLLLAEQFRRSFGMPYQQTLATIYASESEYRAVFSAQQLDQKFQCMVALLARVACVRITAHLVLPFSILPVFEERNTKFLVSKPRPVRPKNPALEKRLVAVAINAALPPPSI